MNKLDLKYRLEQLQSLKAENEVVEFKEAGNNYDFKKLGKYFSALSNEANLLGKDCAWLVFGIENKNHKITGTKFRENKADLDRLKREIADKTSNRITFSEILSLHPKLAFSDVFLLDQVQKKKEITDDEFKYLKKLKFVEGRKPNIYLSHAVIEPLNDEGLKAEYIRNKGFDDDYYKNLIIEYLIKWKEASRKQVENLLWDKLSDVLDEKSKFIKVTNLLQTLRKAQKVVLNEGKKWILKNEN